MPTKKELTEELDYYKCSFSEIKSDLYYLQKENATLKEQINELKEKYEAVEGEQILIK